MPRHDGDASELVTERGPRWRAPIAVLAASFLFNLGQGVLRPSMPLYLQRIFAAKYQMVTFIPVVFGTGKWAASLPTGYLMDRVGRRTLMACGLLVIALCDIASMMTSTFGVFLGFRGVAGVGWAMFGTVATAAMVDVRASERRGRAVSLLFISETLGLLLGSTAGGWLYQSAGVTSPFVFEAACMVAASVAVAYWTLPAVLPSSPATSGPRGRHLLGAVLRIPGVVVIGFTNATLTAIQTGLLVFLFPLYLVNRGHVAPGTVGIFVSIGVLGRLITLWLGGSVSDRRDRVHVMISGLLAYAGLLATVAFLTNPVALAFWSFAIGGAAGLVTPLPTALIGDQVPSSLHGVAIGWLRMMTDGGQILGPLVLGALADGVDLSASFVAGGAVLLLMAWLCR